MTKLDGHMQIVDLDRVGALSLEGWRVLESFETDELVEFEEQTPPPNQPSGYNVPYLITTKKTSIKVRVRKFLMQLDEESAIGKLGEKLVVAQLQLREAQEQSRNDACEREKLTEQFKELDAALAKRGLEIERANAKLKDQQERLGLALARERDLTNAQEIVRAAIGAIRFAEILGVPIAGVERAR